MGASGQHEAGDLQLLPRLRSDFSRAASANRTSQRILPPDRTSHSGTATATAVGQTSMRRCPFLRIANTINLRRKSPVHPGLSATCGGKGSKQPQLTVLYNDRPASLVGAVVQTPA